MTLVHVWNGGTGTQLHLSQNPNGTVLAKNPKYIRVFTLAHSYCGNGMYTVHYNVAETFVIVFTSRTL